MSENKVITRNSGMLTATNTYLAKIKDFAKETNLDFTEYQKQCVVNAVRKINPLLKSQNITWHNLEVDNIYTVLQQTAFLKLNPSAVPNECYYIIRKYWNGSSYDHVLEFGVEGAGNDVILRKFGQDVADIKSYIVYKGDEFTEGYMDGWEMTLPKHKRTFKSHIPEKAVYLIKKSNDEIDVQYSDTEDVKKSLLANAKQNGAEDNLLRELNKLKLYDILNDEKWLNYTIKKKGYGKKKDYETPLFNPSYTSPISQQNMIERKLRNHATRKYPKNFNTDEVSKLYENTFDEKYDEQGNIITAEEKLQITQDDFETNSGSEYIDEKVENDNRPTIEEDTNEEIQADDNGEVVEQKEETEEGKEETIEKQSEKETQSQEKEEQPVDKEQSSDEDEWWK